MFNSSCDIHLGFNILAFVFVGICGKLIYFPKLCIRHSAVTASKAVRIDQTEVYNIWQIRWATPGFGRGGQEFFQICEFACREAAHGEAMRIARGYGGMLPREIFLKRCYLVRFRVYFDQIVSLFFSSINNILDTRLLWGISHKKNFFFLNMLRLMRFGVYFETKRAIFIKK